jgi:ATP-dependent 26S proteasome regulatory subunit
LTFFLNTDTSITRDLQPSQPLPENYSTTSPFYRPVAMALDNFYHNKIESLKLEIIQGQAVLRRLEAQRNDYNSRVRLLREELGLLQQPGSYVGEVVKVMGTKKVLVKVHPEGKYGKQEQIIISLPSQANLA